MDFSTSVFLGIALAMDCFAISITIGLKEKAFRVMTVMRTAIAFGVFQGVMPLIGWGGTMLVHEYLVAYGPWIAFAMLAFIGVKMIVESVRGGEEEGNFDVSNWGVLIYLAIATSIDALAVGVSYGALGVSIWVPAVVIGFFSFAFSVAGVKIGAVLGNIFGNKAEMVGGIVLCALSLKILVESFM